GRRGWRGLPPGAPNASLAARRSAAQGPRPGRGSASRRGGGLLPPRDGGPRAGARRRASRGGAQRLLLEGTETIRVRIPLDLARLPGGRETQHRGAWRNAGRPGVGRERPERGTLSGARLGARDRRTSPAVCPLRRARAVVSRRLLRRYGSRE